MSELLSVFDFTAQQAKQLSAVQSVTDAPIVLGDVTVIPVSKLSCGFAGGGSDLIKNPSGVAAGAGVKITKTPLSFLAVCGSDVQLLQIPAEDAGKKSLVESLTPLIAQFKEKRDAKKAEKNDAAKSGAADSTNL
ncbi:MAG: GerW family sporulation protein [Oscillospiraceae bacterium]|nr:GerW family sporulation protein [Oscillospiraceae bacterium]